MSEKIPVVSLARTKAALDAYDQADAEYQAHVDGGPNIQEGSDSKIKRATARELNEYNDKSDALLQACEAAGVKVGEAFAEDTADRNSRETALLVRPDPWLRRLVAEWLKEQGA